MAENRIVELFEGGKIIDGYPVPNSDFGREKIFVSAGQTMDWLTRTTKEILSHPKTVRVRVE